ncbi:UNVERIFIED_CONTAM: protein LURP-one-related 11 [Sesamum radiatum]|uniref:Protein LURP-one-related 11 n=1 Tax=Sesamum radiatum TaxID=300843 RepID=A0AAW2TUW2_SESRA
MAKVHPRTSATSSSCHENSSSEREVFTVWMKSLVISSSGCTVFNSKGEIVFRVDNYQTRRSREILLMDYNGRVLFSIKRKKVLIFRSWEGYKWTNSEFDDEEGEWFKDVIRLEDTAATRLWDWKENNHQDHRLYRPSFSRGDAKQSFGGVSLGDDVLSLTVEPQIDQSLIMALVIVYAMINHKL